MSDFDIAIDLVLHAEGGYWKGFSDSFTDPGGETYSGIARNFHPNWSGWFFIDDMKKAGPIPWKAKYPQLDYHVKMFYRDSFWIPMSLGRLEDQSVANSILDMSVNLGANKAISKIQMFLNQTWNQVLKVDGIMGPKTIDAINKLPAAEVNNGIIKARVRHYLKKANPEILPALLERCLVFLVG